MIKGGDFPLTFDAFGQKASFQRQMGGEVWKCLYSASCAVNRTIIVAVIVFSTYDLPIVIPFMGNQFDWSFSVTDVIADCYPSLVVLHYPTTISSRWMTSSPEV